MNDCFVIARVHFYVKTFMKSIYAIFEGRKMQIMQIIYKDNIAKILITACNI